MEQLDIELGPSAPAVVPAFWREEGRECEHQHFPGWSNSGARWEWGRSEVTQPSAESKK